MTFLMPLLISLLLATGVGASLIASGLTEHPTADQTETSATEFRSCIKIKAPVSGPKQCNGTTGQTAAASRHRTISETDVMLSRAGWYRGQPLFPVAAANQTAIVYQSDPPSGRSPFWRIFAFAPRLRR